MLHNFSHKIISGIAAFLLSVAGFLGATSHQIPDIRAGASIPVVVSLFETSLQSKINTSDTSMTLVSGTDRQGNSLSGFICFTIDEGTSNVEFVCGTASSTSVTG